MNALQQRVNERKAAYRSYLWNRIKTDRDFGITLAMYANHSVLDMRRHNFSYPNITLAAAKWCATQREKDDAARLFPVGDNVQIGQAPDIRRFAQ